MKWDNRYNRYRVKSVPRIVEWIQAEGEEVSKVGHLFFLVVSSFC